MVATFIARTYDRDVDYYVPAAQVARMEAERYALASKGRLNHEYGHHA